MVAIMALSDGPVKTAGLQGKARRVRGPFPWGAAMDSSAYQRAQVLPQRGYGVRSQPASCVGAPGGSTRAINGPLPPQKVPLCRENAAGLGGRALWVRRWARVAFGQTQQVLPQRGHGPRPRARQRLARGPSNGSASPGVYAATPEPKDSSGGKASALPPDISRVGQSQCSDGSARIVYCSYASMISGS
jgi:hypothetical protein